MLILMPNLKKGKIQTVAAVDYTCFYFKQSKIYYYGQTTAVIIKVTAKWTMPILLNIHVHE